MVVVVVVSYPFSLHLMRGEIGRRARRSRPSSFDFESGSGDKRPACEAKNRNDLYVNPLTPQKI
jgi:hypothetical protein